MEEDMMNSASQPATTFSASRFLADLEQTAQAINAPFSKTATLTVLKAFDKYFKNSALVLRATNRPNDALNYRLFLPGPADTITTAIDAHMLDPAHPLVQAIRTWASICYGSTTPSFWCDFDAAKPTLVKTWLKVNPVQPIEDLLQAPGVPDGIRSHLPVFQSLGLESTRYIAIDYHSSTVNFYFLVPGQVSREQANAFTALAGCPPPNDEKLKQIREFMNPEVIFFAVTMRFPTGEIPRVAFYALDLELTPALDQLPPLDERLGKFLHTAKSYDESPTSVVAWSFGRDGKEYMKVEMGYAGELRKVVGWPVRAKALL